MSSYKHILRLFIQIRNCYCMLFHVKYEFQSESTLYSLPECQGTPCAISEVKRQQRDSNLQPLSSETNTQPFSQTCRLSNYGWVFVYELSDCGFEPHCCHKVAASQSSEYLDSLSMLVTLSVRMNKHIMQVLT